MIIRPYRFGSGGGGGNGLLTGLIPYWKLDEASGTRFDAHGSNDLTDNNTVGSAPGKLNNGANFGGVGSNKYLSISDNPSLSITGSLTIAGWIKPSLVNANYIIASKWGASDAYLFRIDGASASGQLGFYVSSDGSSVAESVRGSTVLSPGVFYHVAAVFTAGSKLEIFINGVSDGFETATAPSAIFDSTEEFRIGWRGDNADNPFDGVIDELGIWSRPLSAADLSALYNSGSGLAYSSFD